MIYLVFILMAALLYSIMRTGQLEQEVNTLKQKEEDEALGECNCRTCIAERKNELLTEQNDALTEGIEAAYELLICQKAANN